MKKTDSWKSASVTIEAAFVMPIIILTIVSIIYLSFCLHDRCRIQGAVDKALHKAGLSAKHDADIVTGAIDYKDINDRGVFYILFGDGQVEKQKIEGYLNRQLSEGLFIFHVKAVNTKVGKFNIYVQVDAETKIEMLFLKKLIKQFTRIQVRNSVTIHNPAETIRCSEVILETGSSIKGVEALKEKLEKILGG